MKSTFTINPPDTENMEESLVETRALSVKSGCVTVLHYSYFEHVLQHCKQGIV